MGTIRHLEQGIGAFLCVPFPVVIRGKGLHADDDVLQRGKFANRHHRVELEAIVSHNQLRQHGERRVERPRHGSAEAVAILHDDGGGGWWQVHRLVRLHVGKRILVETLTELQSCGRVDDGKAASVLERELVVGKNSEVWDVYV